MDSKDFFQEHYSHLSMTLTQKQIDEVIKFSNDFVRHANEDKKEEVLDAIDGIRQMGHIRFAKDKIEKILTNQQIETK